MAPVQKTFSVIPEPPSAFANGSDTPNARQSKPPMTTKQAKKLYKAANKAPKLSKAEQRRQDLMEQDRIRREFEKERNQARAKTARDKRKEKEEKQKAEKKRKGLPLVEVHPSQDTLARFIQPQKPPKKKVEEVPKPPPPPSPPSSPSSPQTAPDDGNDHTSPADDDHRPVKRQRLEEPVEQMIDDTTCDQSLSRSPEFKAQEEAAPELPTVEADAASSVVRPSGYGADNDPTTEDQIGKRNADESFSADDGLDDDDFSAFFVDVAINPEPCSANAVTSSRQSQQLLKPPGLSEGPDPALRPEEHVHPPADISETVVSRNNIDSSSQHLKDSLPHETQEADRIARDGLPTMDSVGLTETTLDLGTKASTTRNNSSSHTTSSPPLDKNPIAADSHRATDVVSNSKKPLSERIYSKQTPVTRREPPSLPPTVRQPLSTGSNARTTSPPNITPKMGPPPVPRRLQSSKFENSVTAGNRSQIPQRADPMPRAVTTNSNVQTREQTADEFMPPSSTQLFLLNNLEDLFPSPSQEMQEIFEKPRENRKRTITRQPSPPRLKPSITAAKVRNYPVTPQVSSVKQPMRQRTFPSARMMPLVSPPKPKQKEVPHMPLQSRDQRNISDVGFPFLSTQDVFMSSQDIRELEEDTSSPINPSKPLQPISCNQTIRESLPPKHNGTRATIDAPDGQIVGSGVAADAKMPKLDTQMAIGVQGQLPYPINAPASSSSQSSSLPDTPSLPRRNTRAHQSRFIHPLGAPRSSAKGAACGEQRSSSSNPYRFKASAIGALRTSQGFQNTKTVPTVESTGAARPHSRETPRPSPKPFFTSSGTRESTLLAIERSKRTAREDAHARRKAEEDLVRHEESKRLKATIQNGPIAPARENGPLSDHDVDDDDYELDEILLASDLDKDPPSSKTVEPQVISAANCGIDQTRSQCRKRPIGAMLAQNRPRSPDEKRPESAAQGKPKSSYEKMLELAARQRDCHGQGAKRIESMLKESEKENRRQDIPTASSQGTDYGDATWDMTDLDLDSLL